MYSVLLDRLTAEAALPAKVAALLDPAGLPEMVPAAVICPLRKLFTVALSKLSERSTPALPSS